MHPSVWPPEETHKEAGSMSLMDRLDKIASRLEDEGHIREAYELDIVSNELENFWKNNQSTLFFDEMTNQEIRPEETEKILRAYEQGADTEFSVSDVTGIDSYKCKKVLDTALEHDLLNR